MVDNGQPPVTSRRYRRGPIAKRMRPETLGEARAFDRRLREVEQAGLCRKCAGQYAWGVQIGFAYSHPPCPACQRTVDASDGRRRPNGWRTMHHHTEWAAP